MSTNGAMAMTAPDDTLAVLEKDLPQRLVRYATVHSAYVFGSVALGLATDRSDLDIAVRLDPALNAQDAFDLRLALIDEVEALIHRPVDVVVLNAASLKLIYQVLVDGRLIYTVDPDAEEDYRIQKRKEFFDFQYYIGDEKKALVEFFESGERA